MRLGMVSTYPPRRGGVAGYAAQLGYALAPEFDVVVCAVDRHKLNYPDEVVAIVQEDDPQDYRRAARILAENAVDVALIQDDGGPAGDHLLDLAHELQLRAIPYLLALHALRPPSDVVWTRRIAAIAARSAAVIVFTHEARRLLIGRRIVDSRQVRVLPPGVPAVVRTRAEVRPDIEAAIAGADRVLATVGYLAPSKGIEVALAALAQLTPDRPSVRYVVAGPTHPAIAAEAGEAYRVQLRELADALGIGGRVEFLDRHLDPADQGYLLSRTDIYLAPTLPADRTYSSSLASAMAAGCGVVAGWHPFSAELLAAGGGVVVPGADPTALAQATARLLDDPKHLNRVRVAAARVGRRITWPALANRYAAVVRRVAAPATPTVQVPAVRLSSFVDEQADLAGRCAVVAAGLLGLPAAALPADGWTRVATWAERSIQTLAAGVEDPGWTLRGTGALAHADGVPMPVRESAWRVWRGLVHSLVPQVAPLPDLAGMARLVLGLACDPNPDVTVRAAVAGSAAALASARPPAPDGGSWPWFADRFVGEDARLAQAMVAAGRVLGDGDLQRSGLRSLDWFASRTDLSSVDGVLRLPGHGRGAERAIDAAAAVEAFVEAFRATGSARYARLAQRAFGWFHGLNRYSQPVYDEPTGNCLAELRSPEHGSAEPCPHATLAYLGAALALVATGLAEVATHPTAMFAWGPTKRPA